MIYQMTSGIAALDEELTPGSLAKPRRLVPSSFTTSSTKPNSDDRQSLVTEKVLPNTYYKAILPFPILLPFYITPPLKQFLSIQATDHSLNQSTNPTTTLSNQPTTTVNMSDTGRKDLHDSTSPNHSPSHCRLTAFPEVADHATPNSSKSTTDKVTDSVSGVTDKVQR